MKLAVIGLLIVLPLFPVAACDSQNSVRRELDLHQRQWARQDIASYRYQLKVRCFCPTEVTDPVVVEVKDRTASSVVYAASGQAAESRYFERYDTMDEVFLVIDDALKRGAEEISVTYDETVGFPASIYIDFVKQAVDDEIAYEVTEFRALR